MTTEKTVPADYSSLFQNEVDSMTKESFLIEKVYHYMVKQLTVNAI